MPAENCHVRKLRITERARKFTGAQIIVPGRLNNNDWFAGIYLQTGNSVVSFSLVMIPDYIQSLGENVFLVLTCFSLIMYYSMHEYGSCLFLAFDSYADRGISL